MDSLLEKHSAINKIKRKLNDTSNPAFDNFKSNPAYREVVKIDETIGVHVIDSGDTDDTPKVYLIPEPPHKFYAGDVVESKDYGRWLCTTINTSLGYNKGFFQPVNKDIKWIVDDKLITKPAIVSSKTLYTTGIKDEGAIKVPNGMVGIVTALDDVSETITRDMNFIFNKTKYMVTFYDNSTTRGILSLICEEVGASPRDDMENEIADRYRDDGTDRLAEDVEEPEEPENPSEINLKILGEDKIIFGQTSEYIGRGTQENKIRFELSNNRLATIVNQGQSYCNIQANMSFDAGYTTLRMYLVEDESIYAEKRIEVGM